MSMAASARITRNIIQNICELDIDCIMGGYLGTMQRDIKGREDIDSLLKKLEDIEAQVIKLANEAKLIRMEIERWKTKDTNADSEIIQMVCSHGCSDGVLESSYKAAIHFDENQQLLGRVKESIRNSMKDKGVKVDFVHISEAEKRPSCLPITVLCLSATRLGTDVTTALQNIKYDHSVAVVIVHHAKPHALPTETSEWILTEEKFEKLGLIVDIAFETSHGMYACDMNKKSIDKLCEFIRRFQQG